MDVHSEKILTHYTQAYQMLYKRSPKDVRMLGNGWVSVNGAKMRLTELEFLTNQLQLEYNQLVIAEKRGIVKRLLNWFKQ
jgi:hypothetical protein